ncbi:MAG: sigma-70 family RNA polymerase sigma factor, partial [Oscillospiraceae bacterium]|nr:sigma-70 family RNA polymerase sigma factor [Oscillospiraceae bacterium]
MDKKAADSLITEYTKKIFGFALGKTASVDEAEELAARITLDVYVSLRGAGEIANVQGYVYRVASNVYARYVDELARGRTVSLNSLDLSDARLADTRRFEQQILDGAEAAALRREVSRLGRMQREVLVLHYFERLNVREIARRLGIPDGTVKWHLSDARKSLKARIELKEGINMTREIGKLGMNPVSFSDMGHSGKPGKFGDTAHFLARRLTQNIVYAAYYEPRTVTEIADELGVSAAFVEDETKYLEEYGFLDSLKGGKLRANVIIDDLPPEYYEAEHKLLLKYAEIVKKQYVPGVIEALDALPRG